MRTRRIRTRGVTLVEVMMVLGVLSIILGLVMNIYSITHERGMTNQTVQEVFEIMQGIYEYKETHGTMNGITATYLSHGGLIPNKYVASDNLILTPHGGQISFNEENWNSDGLGGVAVWLNGLSRQECIALVQLDMSQYASVRRVNWEPQYNQSLTGEQGASYAELLCNLTTPTNQIEFNSN